MGVIVRVPASCGELVQGILHGYNFLVTCPINRYSRVEVALNGDEYQAGEKTIEAVRRTLALFGQKRGFSVRAAVDLPCGKGMASSSADIAAACYATARCLGKSLTDEEIATIALSIEPTDGVFFPGIVLFDHLTGSVCHRLGRAPSMSIAVFDTGGHVNTQEFNRRGDLAMLNKRKERQIEKAVDLLVKGFATNDCGLIGQAATISSFANQDIIYKSCLAMVAKCAERFGAVGVNIAHSGTIVGILFDNKRISGRQECIHEVSRLCGDTKYMFTVELISGGFFEGDF